MGVLYGVGLLIGVGLFAKGRLDVFRDMVLAALLAVVIVVALTQLIDDRWPEFAVLRPEPDPRHVPGVLRHDGHRDPGRGVAVADGADAQDRLDVHPRCGRGVDPRGGDDGQRRARRGARRADRRSDHPVRVRHVGRACRRPTGSATGLADLGVEMDT